MKTFLVILAFMLCSGFVSQTYAQPGTAYTDNGQVILHTSAKGGWGKYSGVDFSGLRDGCYVTANVKVQEDTEVVFRESRASGREIARMKVVCRSGDYFNRDNSGQWQIISVPLEYIPRGACDLYVICRSKTAEIDKVEFRNRESYFKLPEGAFSTPDSAGFIRRWMLLDPIDKPNRSNIVLTDSYLDAQFNREYFAGQFDKLPTDGQTVNVDGQALTWHALESERYNVKLFRFADERHKQVYGVLFWAVTVIECDDEIRDVRLAAGSNSASSWWLNGECVLLLSGDRRMVEDDGMSSRLTLHKGANVLRCAVINGPGMSDFCVRFVNADGSPVRKFRVKGSSIN